MSSRLFTTVGDAYERIYKKPLPGIVERIEQMEKAQDLRGVLQWLSRSSGTTNT